MAFIISCFSYGIIYIAYNQHISSLKVQLLAALKIENMLTNVKVIYWIFHGSIGMIFKYLTIC